MKWIHHLIISTMFITCMGTAYAENNVLPPYISVAGQAEIKTVPDQAVISFTIEKNSKDLDKIQDEADKIASRVISFATANLRVDEEDIHTRFFTVQPVYEYRQGSSYQRTGELSHYALQKGIEILLKNMDNLQELIDYAVESGVTTIGNIQFKTSKQLLLEADARKAAAKDAKAKAGDVASALGIELGKPIEISVGASSPIIYKDSSSRAMLQKSALAIAEKPATLPGQIGISANVHIKFAIDD